MEEGKENDKPITQPNSENLTFNAMSLAKIE